MGRGAPEIKNFKGEEAFTSAILSVTEARTPHVYFTSGHGEASLDSGERGQGYADAKQLLERDNLAVAKWSRSGRTRSPRTPTRSSWPGRGRPSSSRRRGRSRNISRVAAASC